LLAQKILYPGTKKIQSAGGILHKNGLSAHIGYGEEDSNQFNFARSVDYVTGAAMAVRRKLFEDTGLFDTIYRPAYFEETDKCVRARRMGFKVVYVPESIVYHYESTTHGVGTKSYLRLYHTNRFRFIYRNCDFRSYFLDFIPSELKWFLTYCPPFEKGLVMKAHMKALFTSDIIFNKKSPELIKN